MDLNEGAWVHKLFAGCPTLNVSIAIQNAYSSIESMDLNDYDCAKNALTVFVEHLNEEKIGKATSFIQLHYKEFSSMSWVYSCGAGANYGTALESALKMGDTIHIPSC